MVLRYFHGMIKSLNSILQVRKFQEEEIVLLKSKSVWKGDNSQSPIMKQWEEGMNWSQLLETTTF